MLPVAPGGADLVDVGAGAEYVPGVIWQVAGRAYLAKPYGVSKTVCAFAASQILELTIFLLANILHWHGMSGWFWIAKCAGDARAAEWICLG